MAYNFQLLYTEWKNALLILIKASDLKIHRCNEMQS